MFLHTSYKEDTDQRVVDERVVDERNTLSVFYNG